MVIVNQFIKKGKAALWYLRAKKLKLRQIPPNYVFREQFKPGDIAIDVGTGNDPDFSKYLIANYGMKCFAVDPTRKHGEELKKLERATKEFHYLPYALGPRNGKVQFYESIVNVSGSLLQDHRNIVSDPVTSYVVDMVTVDELLRIIGEKRIAIMKLDLEGVEYQLIGTLNQGPLKRIQQLIIEFHHDIVRGISWQDTNNAIHMVKKRGMKGLVYNGRDCLFYW